MLLNENLEAEPHARVATTAAARKHILWINEYVRYLRINAIDIGGRLVVPCDAAIVGKIDIVPWIIDCRKRISQTAWCRPSVNCTGPAVDAS